ncbi:MAG: lysoplasmalogenase [Bacteroidales bacterium]
MNSKQRLLHLVFLVIVAVELTGRITGSIQMEYWVKPLIMPWILLYFLMFRRSTDRAVLPVLAFFFSWVGDMLLMFSDRAETFFFAGVGGFFAAQVCYILAFARRHATASAGPVQKQPAWILPFAAYLAGIYLYLWPGLEGLMRPIILVYALSLIGMSVMALNRRGRVTAAGFQLVFFGSLLFVSSDSMIALNKFRIDIPQAGFLIMATYILAQYLIMRGLVLEEGTPKNGN